MRAVWQPARLVGMRYFSLIEARSFVLIFSTVTPLASRYWAHRSQQPPSGFLYILTGMPAASTESGKLSAKLRANFFKVRLVFIMLRKSLEQHLDRKSAV